MSGLVAYAAFHSPGPALISEGKHSLGDLRMERLDMEALPKGANFVRAKTLWEIGLHIAGNPATPYGGNRDMVITVGSGSGAAFRPWLRLATGSAILAEEVAKGAQAGGGVDLAFVNPSALLTQAYRGVGLFRAPLPVRIVAVYPSWDRFVFMVHPRTGIRSLADIKAKRYPLRVSVREDPTHSTLVLIEQAFALHGFALADIESWGGRLVTCGGPSDMRRLAPLARGEIDAVFDEGIKVWLDEALAAGLARSRSMMPSSKPWGGSDGAGSRFRKPASRGFLATSTRSISAAGRSTPMRRFRTRSPTTSALRSPHAKRRFPGRRERARPRCRWCKRARTRRWTSHSIRARRAGTASTGRRIKPRYCNGALESSCDSWVPDLRSRWRARSSGTRDCCVPGEWSEAERDPGPSAKSAKHIQ
jgi:hypothetical protein